MEPKTVSNGTPAIYGLLAKAAAEVGAIEKGKTNEQGAKFRYRGIDDIRNALHPIMARLGIVCVPEVLDSKRAERTTKSGSVMYVTYLRIKFTYYAADGSSVSATTEGEAFDSGDKSTNKAHSVAEKYAYISVFNIPTEGEEDPDASTYTNMVPADVADFTNAAYVAAQARTESDAGVEDIIRRGLAALKVRDLAAVPANARARLIDAIAAGHLDSDEAWKAYQAAKAKPAPAAK